MAIEKTKGATTLKKRPTIAQIEQELEMPSL